MGERADELNSRDPYYGANDSDNYAILPTDQNDAAGSSAEQSPEEIRANIESTRAELSDTINALQEKLSPQDIIEQAKNTAVEAATQVIDHAKESIAETLDHAKDSAKEAATEVVDHTKQTVHDATVGKVEHMVSNIGETAQETGSGIVETIKKNPIPAALVGLGLGWLFMRGQNKPATHHIPPSYTPGYGYQNQYPGQYGSSYTPPTQRTGTNEGITDRLMGTIRQNPLPAAVAGISLGYLVTQGQSSGKQSSQQQYRPDYDYYNRQQNLGQKAGNVAGQVGDKMGDITHQAGQKVGDIADKAGNLAGKAGDKIGDAAWGVTDTVSNVAGSVGNTVGDVAGTVGETVGNIAGGVGETVGNIAGGVGDTVGGVATGVQYQAQRAQSQFGRMLEEQPLMVGAMAMALGLGVGLMLPNTEQENKLLGEARDNLLDQAQGVVQDTVEKVGTVAQKVGEVAQNATHEVQETVSREAKNQGLVSDNSGSGNNQSQKSGQGTSGGSSSTVTPTSYSTSGTSGSSQSSTGSSQRSTSGGSNQPNTGGTQRPVLMNNLSSTQMEELERQVRQNDRQGFLRLTASYGWNNSSGEEVWSYMTHRPTQDEVYRAFGNEGGQQGQASR
jgi:hypothetical protein